MTAFQHMRRDSIRLLAEAVTSGGERSCHVLMSREGKKLKSKTSHR